MRLVLLLAAICSPAALAEAPRTFQSHPPIRPLPFASPRPLGGGPHYFVDPGNGQDTSDGSRERPWKTLVHAVSRLEAGDTLCLRGGIYHEHVTIALAGTSDEPITIRAYPGELPILDGGVPEFFNSPETAWEPCPDGVEGEYRSSSAYPELGAGENGFNAHAWFGDAMVPMQGYRFLTDLRDPSMAWDLKNKVGEEGSVYCGPGVFYDVKSGRFHARLAHTTLRALGDDNYRGVTDPRQLPLIVAAWKHGPTLTIRDSSDLQLQDLVVRGSVTATVDVSDSARLVFDGLTVYSGQSAFRVRDTAGLRLLNTACRGIAAPWTFRGHLKYRSSEARIFSASGWSPTGRENRDFELAWCEFTDSVDGVFVGNVKGLRFHHNLLDNISDDGIFLTSGTGYDGITHGGDVEIFQNVLSRCLTTFAFGVGHGRQKTLANGIQTGSGVHIYRNVLDFRRPVMYQFPSRPDGTEELPSKGRFASDHGGPAWEPMNIYHNTIIADDPDGYDYGTTGFTRGLRGGNTRRVFNNLVVQLEKFLSTALVKPSADLEIDGNLFWSVAHGASEDFLARFRQSKNNVPSLGVHDRFADPRFATFSADWREPLDLRLEKGSAAIDASIAIPHDWPDVATRDEGQPDAGAVCLNGEAWHVGVRGRLSMFGEPEPASEPPTVALLPFADSKDTACRTDVKPAAIVEGYPELDAPIVEYLLKREDICVDRRERAWLDPAEYGRFRLVVLAGDLRRAGMQPDRYSKDDLEFVHSFLNEGGTLLLLRRGKRVFDLSPEGQKFLQDLTGRIAERENDPRLTMIQPLHSWLKHLDPKAEYLWLKWRPDNDNSPLRVSQGERIIASAGGTCLLYRVEVGRGQIVYMGWQAADSMPHGRLPSSVEAEEAFEEQVRILAEIVKDVYPPAPPSDS